MLGSQMRLPVVGAVGGAQLPLPSPRHHLGGGGAGGVAGGGAGAETRHELETSIQNWRDTFLNKYHEQARAEVGLDASLYSDQNDKKFVLLYV